MLQRASLGVAAALLTFSSFSCGGLPDAQREAREFLEAYESLYQPLYKTVSEAYWKSSTDVTDANVGERIGADNAYAVFTGNRWIIERTRSLLGRRGQLEPVAVKQLEKILLAAAEYPGTIPGTVAQRVEAEARQSAVLDSYEFCAQRRNEECVQPVTPNEIDEILRTSPEESQRRRYWEISKEVGPDLKPGLAELRRLRNELAREMGFESFFALQVADYGMDVGGLTGMMERFLGELDPLYKQLHTWAKHRLAERFGQPVPERIPAHWIGNRWAQSWPGLSEGVNLDGLVADKTPEWIVEQAEAFYTSLGMPALPKSFWEKSDLYELPADAARRKNTHASAWHMDLEQDVRSLMSVTPNFRWFQTSHHELGHVYYFLAYANSDVPLVLREGANRAFHEAVGDLIGIAARQPAYLREIGLLDDGVEIDQVAWLLDEALDQAVVFLPFSAGTMTFWERDLYEADLPPEEFNARWWEHAGRFQGIEPPGPRSEEFCDACTKTHVNDDPAQYYDYAMAFVLKYQLHTHIAKNILQQDPRNCNYYGNKEVGEFLWEILRLGATRDWRDVIREQTGEEVSTRAMLEYFAPLIEYLEKENAGRKIGWD